MEGPKIGAISMTTMGVVHSIEMGGSLKDGVNTICTPQIIVQNGYVI